MTSARWRKCERYTRGTLQTGKHPPFHVTHTTGIFDQYLAEAVTSEQVSIVPGVLAQVGTALCPHQYHRLHERGLPGTMLGGGARHVGHFTEFVGGDIHITINMREVDELLRLDGPVAKHIDTPTPFEVAQELAKKRAQLPALLRRARDAPPQVAGLGR